MFARMKMGTRILAAFGVVLALVAALTVVSSWNAGRLGDIIDNFAARKLPSSDALNGLRQAETAVRANGAVLTNPVLGADLREDARKRFAAAVERVDQAARAYAALPHGQATAALWETYGPAAERWKREVAAFQDAVRERERAGAQAARAEALDRRIAETYAAMYRSSGPVVDTVKKLMEQTSADARALNVEADKVQGGATVALAVAVGLIAALLAGVGWALARSIGAVIRGLLAEAGKISAAVEAGKLDVRGDPAAVALEFQPVVAGVNRTLDAFQRPIQVTEEYVGRISRGDIPPKITDHYEGDFDQIKQALNRCIDAVGLLVEDAGALSRAAVEGKLSTRADASRHQGDFQKVVAGVNATLDAILAPINEARGVLEKLAERDLTARMQGSYQGDHAAIKEALNAAAGALHDALGQVADAVEQVSSAAGQIASSSQAVASGASEQASSLEETHSSLESMSAQTRQAADHAQQANTLAAETRSSAEHGAGAMEQMTGAMNKVRQSAEGTSAIIRDISEIAFQTNLLALNAAVEAARAGEAGRGFAVVAEEVRSLALRAKDAAVKTEELIQESVKQAGEGEAVARLASERLVEIVGSAQKVSDIVAEMAAASKEQAQGIEQVNKAVGEMDKVTQQNAASSEESSSAAEELSSQSEELAAMVGSFQISRARGPRKVGLAGGKAKGLADRRGGFQAAAGIGLQPEEIIPLDSDPRFSEF